MRLRQIAGLLAPITLIAAAMALQAERSGFGEAMAAAPVAPAASALISGDYLIAAPGRVEPASEAIMVAASITGVLKGIDVREGDHVRRGDVVARIEDTDYAARLAEAEAQVKLRQAELQRVSNGAEPAERRAAWAAVEMAQAVEKKAGSEFDRKQKLAQSAVASRAALEQAETELEIARERAEQAQQRFDLVNGPTRADDVAIAEAKLEAAEAAAKVAKAALDDTVIRSPIDGTVLRIFRHPGELVSVFVDDPVLSLGDLSALNVRAEIDEADIARVKLGLPAYVTAEAYGQKRFRGHVLRVGEVLGKKRVTTGAPGEREDTKVLDVLVRLDSPTPLRPGLRVDTFILPPTGDAAARTSDAAKYSANIRGNN